MSDRWRETVDLGILSIGREWDESVCQCDASVGCVPCHYCAEHSAILSGEKMLAEIERLWAALLTCTELARGYKHAFPTDRCAAIAAHVNEVLNGKAGGDGE